MKFMQLSKPTHSLFFSHHKRVQHYKSFFSSPRSIPLHYFSLFYLNNPSPVSRPQNWIDLRLHSLQFARFGWGFRFNWEIASQATQTTIWLPLLNVFVTQSEFALLMVNNDFYYHSTQRKIFVWGGRSPEVPSETHIEHDFVSYIV